MHVEGREGMRMGDWNLEFGERGGITGWVDTGVRCIDSQYLGQHHI